MFLLIQIFSLFLSRKAQDLIVSGNIIRHNIAASNYACDRYRRVRANWLYWLIHDACVSVQKGCDVHVGQLEENPEGQTRSEMFRIAVAAAAATGDGFHAARI